MCRELLSSRQTKRAPHLIHKRRSQLLYPFDALLIYIHLGSGLLETAGRKENLASQTPSGQSLPGLRRGTAYAHLGARACSERCHLAVPQACLAGSASAPKPVASQGVMVRPGSDSTCPSTQRMGLERPSPGAPAEAGVRTAAFWNLRFGKQLRLQPYPTPVNEDLNGKDNVPEPCPCHRIEQMPYRMGARR